MNDSAARPASVGLIEVVAGDARRLWRGAGAALFLASLAATGIIDRLRPLRPAEGLGAERAAWEQRAEQARIADGSAAAVVERTLRATSRVRSEVGMHYTLALYRWLDEAHGERVVVGRDGWLFVRERTIPPPGGAAALLGRWSAQLALVDRILRCRGVKPVFVPLPRRAVICADRLPRGIDPRAEIDRAAAAALRAKGLDAVDLFPAFSQWTGEPLFYRADAHWNESGERLAAEVVGRHLGAPPPGAPRSSRVESAGYETQGTADDKNQDLYRFVGIPHGVSSALLRGPDVALFEVINRQGYPAVLVQAPQPMKRIALTGTSFSARRDFSRFLRFELDEPVWNGAGQAQGPIEPVRELLRAHAHELPEILLVEVPIYTAFEPEVMSRVGELGVEFPPPAEHEVPDLVTPAGSAVRGREFEIHGWSELVELPRGTLLHSGDGCVFVRIAGELLAGELHLADGTDGGLWTATWPRGARAISLPLLAAQPGARALTVHARAGGGRAARFRLDRCDIVSTLVPDPTQELATTAAAAVGGGWSREAHFLSADAGGLGRGIFGRLSGISPAVESLAVETRDAGGRVTRLGSCRPSTTLAVVLSASALAAAGDRTLILSASGRATAPELRLWSAEDCARGR